MRIIEEKQKLGYVFVGCDKRGFKVEFMGNKYMLNKGKKNEMLFLSMKEVRNYIESIKG